MCMYLNAVNQPILQYMGPLERIDAARPAVLMIQGCWLGLMLTIWHKKSQISSFIALLSHDYHLFFLFFLNWVQNISEA